MSGKELRAIVDDETAEQMERFLAQEEIDRRKEKRDRLQQSWRVAVEKGYRNEKGERQ